MNQSHWTAGLHHDGSVLYVSNPLPALGDTVTVRLRVPAEVPIRHIFLRTAPDGENHHEAMTPVEQHETFAYWACELPVTMPFNHYRFRVLSEEGAYTLNALGVSRAEGPDWYDFKLLADFATPDWLDDAVFYQIFPDRFYNGDPSTNHADGEWTRRNFKVQFREWGAPPLPYKEAGNVDFYGGDLPGIQQKIDYLRELGVNALYLNPIFESSSNHRYNIKDFYTVDKHLGGDEALIALSDALHAVNMRLILDVTPNHTGDDHIWFQEAIKDHNAPSTAYYTFYEHPDKYEMWLGVPSLPKLNYASQPLRDKMYNDADSVLQHWLRPPYNMDGWRLDVYNMTARQGSLQLSEEVGREMRKAIKADFPQSFIFGEHFFDGTAHLQGDQVDAMMNYQGFNIPMWRWLAGYDLGADRHPDQVDMQLMPSEAFAEQLTRYRGAVPWVIARQQFNQLCSHDTTRILTILNDDKALLRLGVTMLMTYPGVPCLYYGDEIGLAGHRDPDNRRTMPWDDTEWDHDLLVFHRQVIHLRRTAPALRHGGFQQVYAEGGLWCFQRQSPEQQLIVVGYRGPDVLEHVQIPVWHAGLADGTKMADLLRGSVVTVLDGSITLDDLVAGDAFVFGVQQ